MARLIFRQATPADNAALARLFAQTPMGHHIRICTERSPDFFATTLMQCDEAQVFGYFDEKGEAVAIFSAGLRKVWLDGIRPMRYLSDLRIHPAHQGGGLLARGFRRLRRDLMQPGEWAQTLVLGDNKKALALLQSGRAGLPEYRPAGRYATWLMPPQRIEPPTRGIHVRSARAGDEAAMASLHAAAASRRSFVPALDFTSGPPLEDFLVAEREGKLLGMMGVWDQSAFQRLRIDGYSKPLRLIRPLWNCVASLPLPPPGEVLALKKLTAVACHDDDPATLLVMLGHALRASRVPLLGACSEQDPLRKAYAACKSHHASGRHFLVGWQGEPPTWREPFAFDVARI